MGRFIRNWGYIEHSTQKRKYYEISAKIKGNINNLEKFYYIEQFFNKVYVDDNSIVDSLQKIYDDEHIAANKLLDVEFKYKAPVNKALPSLSTDGAEVLLPKYLSSKLS